MDIVNIDWHIDIFLVFSVNYFEYIFVYELHGIDTLYEVSIK